MVVYTNMVPLNVTTSAATTTVLVDRTGKQPLKWFTMITNATCYVAVNKIATVSYLKLGAGESYTTPERVRIVTVNVLREAADTTIRGSAWF